MSNLTACERLELIRHKDRPTVNDYIPAMFTRFMEFHGDRLFGDDAAIIGGIGYLSDTPVTVIAPFFPINQQWQDTMSCQATTEPRWRIGAFASVLTT